MPITFTGDIPTSSSRVITNSWSLNKALRDVLGNEGYPDRSLTEVYGPKGIGKTTFCTSLAGQIAEKKGKGISILDLEIQNRDTIAGILEHTGFDGEVFYVQQKDDERSEDTVERFVDRMYDLQGEKKTYSNPDVGLMDSIGGYRPSAEFDGDIGDANMGIKAREMGQITGRFIRSLQLAKSPHTIFMINHERMPFQSIGFAVQPETGGGETKKYLSHIRIRLTEAFIKKEKWKDSKMEGSVKLEGSWLLNGYVKENRYGLSDNHFFCYIIGGEGIHGGLTSLFECLIMGYAESSSKAIKDTSTISLDGKSYGKLGRIIRDRADDEMLRAFQNRLKVEMVEEQDDTESTETPKKIKKK